MLSVPYTYYEHLYPWNVMHLFCVVHTSTAIYIQQFKRYIKMDNVTRSTAMSYDNITLSQGFNSAIVVLTSVVGLTSFLENSVIVMLLFKLLKTINSNTEQLEFIKQLLFVSGIDTLSSFTLFLLGITKVSDDGTALVCAIVTNLTASFQAMSQCNFTCICTFRYLIARNVRAFSASRKSRFTFTLLTVNTVSFVLVVTSLLSTISLRKMPEGTFIACENMSTVTERARMLMAFIFMVAIIVCTLLSDVMCILTALLLNKDINVVSDGPLAHVESSNTRPTGINNNSSKRQRTAMCTLAVINLCFNVSVLPVILSFVMSVGGVAISPQVGRFVFVLMFLNSIFNPIIIVVRFRQIRRIIFQSWQTFTVHLYRITMCKTVR